MAKSWAKVGEQDRAKVIEKLGEARAAFERKGDRGGVQAVDAALGRLSAKKPAPARRSANYRPTTLQLRLAVEATRAEAIAEMAAAVRTRRGMDHAYEEFAGVSQRTWYRLLEKYPAARVACDEAAKALFKPAS